MTFDVAEIRFGSIRVRVPARGSGEDDALYVGVKLRNLIERMDLAIHVENSRTRRAMIWVYCDPKSRISIFSICMILFCT